LSEPAAVPEGFGIPVPFCESAKEATLIVNRFYEGNLMTAQSAIAD
jgi:hypothetical protein